MRQRALLISVFISLAIITLLSAFFITHLPKTFDSASYFIRTIENYAKVTIYTKELINKAKKGFDTYDKKVLPWSEGPYAHNWSYCDGLMMFAIIKTGLYKNFVNKFYNDNITNKGFVNNKRNFRNIYVNGALDDVAPARTLFYLMDTNNKKKYVKNINFVRGRLANQPTLPNLGNNYIHKTNNKAWIKYPFGLDGLYMALPFELEFEKFVIKKITPKTADSIFERLNWVSSNLKNEEGLYYHGCENDGKTVNGIVWLRGAGWYAMAQVDILELFPEGEHKEILKKQLMNFFDSMLKYQNENNGMWQNVLYPENKNIQCNYFETSGSSMMAYALMSAYINDLVTDEKYAYAGLKAFNGVVENNLIREKFFSDYELKDIYKVAIVFDDIEKYTKCSYYVKNDAKGSAPLILASTVVPKTIFKLFINHK